MDAGPFRLEYYRTASGGEPARRWIDHLETSKRRAAMAAMSHLLRVRGPAICDTEYGRHLGRGLFELRIRHDAEVILGKAGGESATRATSGRRVSLRIFCSLLAGGVIVVLGGYDKGRDPHPRRQARETTASRRRLADHLRRS